MAADKARGRYVKKTRTDIGDQYLFFALFIIGGAAIWWLKEIGWSQLHVTFVPVSFMGVYIFLSLATKRYRLREDKVGDNIYYLGFLYTLTSLSHALYVYDPDGSGATAIVTNFGIAISTTIVGLAGRVFFSQLRTDPVEYEREARYSLAQASNELRANLADITIEVSNFKRKTFQILEEGVVDMSDTARSSLEANMNRFTDTSNEVLETVRSAFGGFNDHAARLNEIASKNVDGLQALFERIEKIEASPDLLSAKLDPVMEKFGEVANEAMKRNRAQTNDLKKMRDIADVAIKAADAIQNSIANADTAFGEKSASIKEGLQESAAALSHFANSVTSVSGTLTKELEISKQAVSALESEVSTHLKSISESRAAAESDLQAMKSHRDATEKMLEESRNAVQEVEKALVSLSRSLAVQLSGR